MSAAHPMVLLAEDDDDLRELLAARLTREGMKVIEIEDGLELRDYLEMCRPGGMVTEPDVVITDWQMPGESGPEALSHATGLHAPIVLISSHSGAALREAGMAAHAVAIFEKPFDLDLLVLAIRKVLHN